MSCWEAWYGLKTLRGKHKKSQAGSVLLIQLRLTTMSPALGTIQNHTQQSPRPLPPILVIL